jgi:1,4-dihydroxy-2-naphthoyl-CoA synthase
MAEYSDIAFHIHEGIARITINRPDRRRLQGPGNAGNGRKLRMIFAKDSKMAGVCATCLLPSNKPPYDGSPCLKHRRAV